jgi:hypothetical protein
VMLEEVFWEGCLGPALWTVELWESRSHKLVGAVKGRGQESFREVSYNFIRDGCEYVILDIVGEAGVPCRYPVLVYPPLASFGPS